jgi:integrase
MKLLLRGDTFHLRRRVPLRYREVEPRVHVVISLHTDSEKTAKEKAAVVWSEMLDAWEAKLDGATSEGAARLAAAKKLAGRRGRTYYPADVVAKLPLEELLQRVEATITPTGKIDLGEAEALLGGVPVTSMSVTGALAAYWKIEAARFIGKSEDQIRRAENPRKKAIRNFIEIVGEKPYLDVTTADLFKVRAWWVERMQRGEVTANSANKDIVYITSTLRAVAASEGETDSLKFTTKGLSLDEGEKRVRPPFSVKWIKDKILPDEALRGLNKEARCIILGMINTGYRPSEGASLTRAQIRLDTNIPHITIAPVGRTLKSNYARRTIPLTGVSLEAFRECPDGFPRYADSPSLSDTINKYLRENGLLETEEHSLYGFRHAFEDRMLAAGIDERIRRDLMGHSLDRERYGKGASLEQLHGLLMPLAL